MDDAARTNRTVAEVSVGRAGQVSGGGSELGPGDQGKIERSTLQGAAAMLYGWEYVVRSLSDRSARGITYPRSIEPSIFSLLTKS